VQVLRIYVAVIRVGSATVQRRSPWLGSEGASSHGETHWIGGESTNQAVRPDEHPWIEEFDATASDRVLRQSSRSYYRTYLPLTPKPAIRKSCYPTGQDLDARIRRCNVSRCGNGPTGD
jgi:hypothetical protein